jgi:hypothetical protein
MNKITPRSGTAITRRHQARADVASFFVRRTQGIVMMINTASITAANAVISRQY